MMSSIIVLGIAWIILTLVSAVVPYWSRSSVPFGIRVPAEHAEHPSIEAVKRSYALGTVVVSIVLFGLSAGLLRLNLVYEELTIAFALTLFVASSVVLHMRAHRQVLQLKAANGWSVEPPKQAVAQLSARGRRTVSRLWNVLPFIYIGCNVLAIALYYDQIPDVLPLHYDATGTVDRYGDKSWGTVLMPNMVQLFLALMMLFVQESIVRSKQQLDPDAPEASSQHNRTFRRVHAIVLHASTLLLLIMMTCIQLAIVNALEPGYMFPYVLILPLLSVVGLIIASAVTGQGGSKLGPSGGYDNADDRYWRWGIFYVNPQDPSIFVEKRVGVGWTLNLGRTAGWIVLVATLAGPLLLVVLLASLTD
ncbi:DUF1648 domain-containing protein [Paenibacillus sp. YYML68]|uniref:DUF1648 domain-containing protein n=1 Tax=Paenibacillus sp. YYML68 TaxID=2909250 RepID=UPI0024906F2E|nr:DUF5808 domain-containing protein [Paenibacillus sp. YYML68]